MAETGPSSTFYEIARREAFAVLGVLRPHQRLFGCVMAAGLLLLPFSARTPLFEFGLSIVLAAALAALVVIDRAEFRLPDTLTLPLIGLGVLLAPPHALLEMFERLAGAAAGFVLLFAVAEGYRLWRGHAGLGLGDAKLFAAAGAWVTVTGLPSVLLIAALSALAVTVAVAYHAGTTLLRTTRIAFGPYLAFGFWIVWLFGPML
jgi:leader peptidase (prepilin peptidase) / N-methyltransferase